MKNKVMLFRSNFILFSVVLLFFINNGIAQETKIYELFETESQTTTTTQISKSTLSKSATKSNSYTNNLNDFYDLNNNLKPTVYVVDNSIVKVSGKTNPLKLNSEDVTSFNVLKSGNRLYQSVELLIVNLENSRELNTPLDLASLQNFNSLKYIYIKCNFKCTVEQIKRFVLNAKPEITIYFITINPS
jgi:hypothetical protein